MGVDSTALLLRWLAEPDSLDYSHADLTVLTAMPGDEFADTEHLVTTHILHRLREARRHRFATPALARPRQARTMLPVSGVFTPAGATCTLKPWLSACVTARLEPLAPQAQPVPAPVQDFDAVGGLVPEHEQMAARRIRSQLGPGQGERAVEPEEEVHGSGAYHCMTAGGVLSTVPPRVDGRGQR